jgi:tetratricopeptide (TPR) repeat protein
VTEDDPNTPLAIVGEPVSIAARLRQMAEPDTLLISGATHQLVTGFFDCRPLDTSALKGVRPIEVYEVRQERGTRSRLEALAETAGLTPLVGRQQELARLPQVWQKARQGHGQVVSVIGEAGIGKSRLMYEFKRQLEQEDISYLEGSCFAYGECISYLPFLRIIRGLFGLNADDPEVEAKRKIAQWLGEWQLEESSVAPYLHNLLSLPVEDEIFPRLTPELIRQRTVEAIRKLLLARANKNPLVVIVEDVHWIDKATEEVLKVLVESLADAPLLLILVYRPEYLYGWEKIEQHWEIRLSQLPSESSAQMVRAILSKPYAARLSLEPLTREQSKALAQELLGTTQIPSEVEELIVTKTEGNPLFVEELTRSLLERGDLVRVNGGYELARPISAMNVPTTLHGVLLERIDRLSEELKQVVRVASVIGRVFDYSVLSLMLEGRESLEQDLRRLEELDFIRSSGPLWGKAYWFKHVLTQEAVYGTLLKGTRQTYHDQVGQAIETLYSDRLEEYYELLAYHYVRSDNEDKAVDYLDLANRKAENANAMVEAKTYFDEALKLLDTMPATETNQQRLLSLVVNQYDVHFSLFRTAEYYDLLTRCEEMAVGLGNQSLLGTFYARVSGCHFALGHFDQAIQTLAKATELCEATGNIQGAGSTYRVGMWTHMVLGNYDQVLRLKEPMLRVMNEEFHFRTYARACAAAAMAYMFLGRWDEAVAEAHEQIRVGEEYSDDIAISFGMTNLALIYCFQNDLARAIEYGEMAVQKAPTLADRAMAQGFLAFAWCRAGDVQKGLKTLETVLQRVRDGQFLVVTIVLLGSLGEGYWLTGEYDKAVQTLTELLELTKRCGSKIYFAMSHRLLGEVALKTNPEQTSEPLAAPYFEISIAKLQAINAENELALAYAGYGRLFKQQGDFAQARTYLTRALEIFERLGTLIEPDKVRQELIQCEG